MNLNFEAKSEANVRLKDIANTFKFGFYSILIFN